jgi:hypothetical protein
VEPRPCRYALALLLALPSTVAATEKEPRPHLVVFVSVDGLSWSCLERYRPWYVSGLKRLFDEGLIETQARYRHLNTETGPGHSSLSTGAPPRVTGITANGWFEEAADHSLRTRYCVQQLGETRDGGAAGPGPSALRVPTLGDRLLAAHPLSRVVSLSAKDRASILMAGHAHKDAVYWFDQVTGRFVTSAAYDPPPEERAVVEAVNDRGMGPGRFGLVWKRLPIPDSLSPASLPRPAADLLDFQMPVNGLGFDHSFTFSPRGYFPSLYLSPFMDELVADLALAFLSDERVRLGRRETPDFLALGFSSQDLVSHYYGSESEENLDVLRRLDLQVGRVLEALDHLGPKGSVVLGLSSDHGFAPIPEAERARNPSFRGGRLVDTDRTTPSFPERLNRLLSDELCLSPTSRPIFGVEGFSLIYNRPALPLRTVAGSCGAPGGEVTSASLDAALPVVAGRFYKEEIQEVLLISERDKWSSKDPAVEFARNDLDLERSGDAFIIPRPNVLMHSDPGRGSGHGTHHEYDIHVPLIFWGGSFRAGRSQEATTPYDMAPTLGARIGVTLPDAVGHDLAP